MEDGSAGDAVLDPTADGSAGTETDPFILHANLTETQIRRARRVMERVRTDKSLGEVLLELGEISEEEYQRVQSLRRARLSLVDLLHEEGHLTDQDVEAYHQAKSKNPRARDYALLVGRKRVSEEVFLRALASTDGVPFVELAASDVDPALLKRTSVPFLQRLSVLPLVEDNGRLQLVAAGPLEGSVGEEVDRIFGLPVDLRYATSVNIAATFQALEQRRETPADSGKVTKLEYQVADAAARTDASGRETVRAVDDLLLQAIKLGASDLHIQPTPSGLRVRVRVDGRMRPLTELSKEMAPRVTSRLKVLAGADISERRLHQDGKIFVKTDTGEVDIRVSSYVSVHGENLVLRLLDRNRGLVPLHKLGFAPRVETLITDVILPSASGLVLITGPTGSGKTTTLYSLMQHDLDPAEVVISAEDPVEYVIDGIVQCSVNEKTGPSFVDSLRAIVRQDPDTIIVGEIRDERTVKMAFESALTGHKVFSTFHTENAVTAIIRLLEMGVAPFLVSSTLSAIVAQRLVRQLCPSCAEASRPSRQELKFLGLKRSSLGESETWTGRGCDTCQGLGYAGRIGLHEVLVPNDEFRDAVLRRAPALELEALARRLPQFMTLQEDGLLKALQYKTTLSELIGNVPRDLNARPVSDLQSIAGQQRPSNLRSVAGLRSKE
jgi:type IV pilus assembly protein PilB